MRARSVTARVTIEMRSSTAEGSTFPLAPDSLTVDHKSTVFFDDALFRRYGFAAFTRKSWIAGKKPKTAHVAQKHDAGLRQVATNLVVLLGRDSKVGKR